MSLGDAVSGRGRRDPSSLAKSPASGAQGPGPRGQQLRRPDVAGAREAARISQTFHLSDSPLSSGMRCGRQEGEKGDDVASPSYLPPHQKAPNKKPREACFLLDGRCVAALGPRATALPPPPTLSIVYFVVSGLIKMLVARGSDLPRRFGCSAPAFPSVFTPAQTPPHSPI